jgi:hypothetical protein
LTNWAAGWTLSLGDVNARNNPYVGVEDYGSSVGSVRVYPNPVVSFATFEFENNDGAAYSFKLYDMAGRTVRRIDEIRYGTFNLQREGLPGGIYSFRLSGDNGQIMDGKLVIQ